MTAHPALIFAFVTITKVHACILCEKEVPLKNTRNCTYLRCSHVQNIVVCIILPVPLCDIQIIASKKFRAHQDVAVVHQDTFVTEHY